MQVTRVNATHAEDNRVVFNVRSCMHFVVTYKEKKKNTVWLNVVFMSVCENTHRHTLFWCKVSDVVGEAEEVAVAQKQLPLSAVPHCPEEH